MNTRVRGAVVIGVALVAAALVVSSYRTPTTSTDAQPVVADTPTFMAESPLREYIPETDSNNDGIPDWQELLNDTEPLELSTATSTFTPPETLTDQFALEFFETYVRNEGFGAFGRDPQEIVNQASDELLDQVQDRLFVETDINIIPSSPDVITNHANAVATIIDSARLPAGTRNELAIVETAVASNDAASLTELDPILENYNGIIEGMQEIPVPRSMIKEHLDLLNALQAVRNDIVGFQKLFADPMVALLRLQRYQDDVLGLGTAVVNLLEKAAQAGSGFTPDDPVYRVYSFE